MAFTCATPATPTVQLDDEAARITRWDFAPGAATGWHRHGLPYFVVMLTAGIMRVDTGAAITETVLQAGETYRRPVGIEHDVMNGGDAAMAFVEIELKTQA